MKPESGSRLMKLWFICTLICVFTSRVCACFVPGITIIRALTKRKWHILPCLIFTLHANGMLIIVTDQRSMAWVVLLPPLFLCHTPPPTTHPLTALAMRKSFGNEHIACICFSLAPDDQWNAGWALMMFQHGQSSHLIKGEKKNVVFAFWIEGKTTNEDKRFS